MSMRMIESKEAFAAVKDVETREVQKTLLAEQAAATQPKFKWVPQQSRIKIELMPEKLSSILAATEMKEPYLRAKILALGAYVGYEDIVVEVVDASSKGSGDDGNAAMTMAKRKKLSDYKVGDIVICLSTQIIKYKGADGVEHIFLKNESFIVAKQEPV